MRRPQHSSSYYQRKKTAQVKAASLIPPKRPLKRRKKHHWIRNTFLVLLTGGIIASGFVTYDVYQAAKDAPKLCTKAISQTPSVQNVYSADNQLLYSNRPTEPVMVNPNNLPQTMNDALLSIEDRNFWHENGINYKRTLLAAVHNIAKPNQKYGASTIDQQVVKQLVWSTKKWHRGYRQKIQEMALTLELNKKLSKKEILAAYYNHIDMGEQIITMGAAAKWYCGTDIQNLSTTQAALLAGMVQAPTNYNPYTHPKHALARRNTVLKAMYDNHKLTKTDYQKAVKVPLAKDIANSNEHKQTLQHRQDLLLDCNYAVTNALNVAHDQKLGDSYNIKTTVNAELQQKIIQAVNSFQYPDKDLQVAVTVMNATNGDVIAQIGGRNQKVVGGFNRAISPSRSCGSTIKPVLDYASAMKYLGWGTETQVLDTAYNYPNTSTAVHDWDGQYQGAETLRKALVESRNIPAVRAIAQVGLERALGVIKPSGYDKKLWYADAIGLNTSSQTLASMYTALANKGNMSSARVIMNINGQDQANHATNVYNEGTAFMLTDILKGVINKNQLGKDAVIDGVQQAGKTGTVGFAEDSNKPDDALSDAWFAGYTPQYVVTIWMGYDHPNGAKYIKQSDGEMPVKLYKNIIEILKNRSDWKDNGWQQPNDVVANGSGYRFKNFSAPINDATKKYQEEQQKQQQAQQQVQEQERQAQQQLQQQQNNLRMTTPRGNSFQNTPDESDISETNDDTNVTF